MKTVNVAILDAEKKLCAALGKKGTASDFTLYNFKNDSGVLVAYEPTTYPEKLQPLLYLLWLADFVLLKVGQVDKYFGECLIAAECSGKPGFVITDNEEKFRAMTKGMAVNGYLKIGENADEIKRAFFAIEQKIETRNSKPETRILIDHYFDVKGVGLVALGKVEHGKIEVHDELTLLPQGKKAGIKSIQVQDKDVKEGGKLERVGLCLKGVELKDLEKGNILTADPSGYFVGETIEIQCTLSNFSKTGIAKDGTYFISAGMQYLAAKAGGSVAPGATGKCTFSLEKKMVIAKGGRVILCNPNGMPRVIGFGNIQ
ncbi:hypothetical protein COT30_02980 [Candidatus Micrarchaeota archaeon CG08_land_8_20_14_0_20_49_17]|nr:MAG: hypothetical protein AUJ13_01955 [Candidatus Micrarchaeota archaeon CG1_02_49_24]PIU09714.1 MAG: hypothetical protein COT30_02980 [Candidatus Micrarchaeota archaeon CG08_land_8_20_14_0_20_49_17]PIZ95512.1 MAG: hypothetical protein COX84_04385 [Candidatus Micrarchaeota archaeon CG_4_10_14_0_2_um_filter_49_7]HII53606.1 hypothetical protein [Candidatus Micrarchaeota archaeon]